DVYKRQAIEIALFNYQDQLNALEPAIQNNGYKKLPDGILKDSIFIKKQHIFHRIAFNDIQYIKSDNVYLEIYTTTQSFLVRSTLKDYLNKLPLETFHRAHKSYIVNINHIQALNVKDIVVADKIIPISKDFKDFLIRSMNS
ncbi:MAG: LytTR family transcriptional regulator, partial [Flavobacteriia bacterium]|nr:LytTR family transcriptional regulator [Flavobacteriia bacterium]